MWHPGRGRLPVHYFTVNIDCTCCQLHLDWNIIEPTNITLTKKITPFYIKLFINFTIDRTQNLHHWGQLHPPWRSTGKGDHWDQPRSGCPGPVVWLGWDGLEKPGKALLQCLGRRAFPGVLLIHFDDLGNIKSIRLVSEGLAWSPLTVPADLNYFLCHLPVKPVKTCPLKEDGQGLTLCEKCDGYLHSVCMWLYCTASTDKA